jgi:probable HAF family extracellular repeat protein
MTRNLNALAAVIRRAIMNFRISARIVGIALFAMLAFPLGIAAQSTQAHRPKHHHYQLTVLPTLGGTFGQALGINSKGSVAGYSTLAGDMQADAFIWQKGMLTDLGTLGGPVSLPAPVGGNGINSRGMVTG